MDYESLIEDVQSGKKNMLDFVMGQPDLKVDFLATMKACGKHSPTDADVIRWLSDYENRMLHENLLMP